MTYDFQLYLSQILFLYVFVLLLHYYFLNGYRNNVHNMIIAIYIPSNIAK